MKKLILVLAIALIASPALALNVELVKVSSGVVAVTYSDANSANLPRAFALTLTITGGTFDSFVSNSYLTTGESTATAPGYGIYPASIDIATDGTVNSYGTPLAASADPGAGDGFASDNIVLEFGSLYYADANAPATSGTLCQINYTQGTATEMTMVDESTYRGGIVLEDGTQVTVSDTLTLESAPEPATNGLPSANVTSLTTDLSWTAGSGATSYDVYFGTVLPTTPTNVTTTTFDTGTMVQGKTYYCSVVAKNAVGSATALTWNFSTDCLKSTATGYSDWVSWGKPSCWGYNRHCRGDWNGTKSGVIWVNATDLNGLVAAYGKNKTALSQITNGICADFNHSKSGVIHVNATDLNILTTYYGKNQTLTPICDGSTVNFWTN